MRPPRIAILVLFFAASLFLLCRSIGSARRQSLSTTSPPSRKSSFGAFFSFTTPFSLFPPSAAISLTDDNSTFFPARPAAFGPPLPAKGLSGQLWIGSGFSDETLQDGEAEGELGCSDIPGWEDERTSLAIKAAVQGMTSRKPDPLDLAVKGPRSNSLDKDPAVDRRSRSDKSSYDKPVAANDGTDDYLHQGYQQTRSSYSDGTTSSEASHADIQSMQETAEITGKVVLLSRGGCGFLEKVKWAQRRGAIALIVGDNQKGGPLIQMYARGNVDNVSIPSVFTSRTTAHLLSSLIQPGSIVEGVVNGHGKSLRKVQHFAKTGASKNSRKPSSSKGRTSAASAPGDVDFRIRKPIPSRRSWMSRLFGWGHDGNLSPGASRPPTSGRLEGVPAGDRGSGSHRPVRHGPLQAGKDAGKDPSIVPGNKFRGGAQNWPNQVEDDYASDSQAFTTGNDQLGELGTSTKKATKAASNTLADGKGLRGGSRAPGSREYVSDTESDSVTPGHGKSPSSSGPSRGFLSMLFGGDKMSGDETEHAPNDAKRPSTETLASISTGTDDDDDDIREGLWVTITPTGSASPFFDTLLVLVISPLITLTVVYALLILRVKIRMRRWRAPKSVVERLPVRTYQTVPSPSQSPETPSPASSSPTTPLLQSSSRSRPQPRTATGVPDTGRIPEADDAAQRSRPPSPEKTSRGVSSQWKKYMGRQVECVVCLEEYVDGVSQVMSLPCGHEFHVECITPWLTTRRRTCPICKNDVVRSLARGTSSGPQYEPFREDGYESNDESSDAYQERFFSPNQIDDLERGPSFTQGSRHNWQAQASRNDALFGALTSRLGRLGGGPSFSTRQGSSRDRDR